MDQEMFSQLFSIDVNLIRAPIIAFYKLFKHFFAQILLYDINLLENDATMNPSHGTNELENILHDLKLDTGTEDETKSGELSEIFHPRFQHIVDKIFSNLDLYDLVDARSVSKQFESFINPLLKFKIILFDQDAEAVETFAKKGLPISCLTVSKLQEFEYPANGLGLTKPVKKLKFIPYGRADESGDGAFIGISDINFRRILKDLKNIEGLMLHSRSFSDVLLPSPLKKLDLPNLTSLKISTLDQDGHGHIVCVEVLENTFPNLSRFVICLLYDTEDDLLLHPPKYKELYQFVGRHKKLKELNLSFSPTGDNAHPHSFLFDHMIPKVECEEIENQLKTIRLSTLSLNPSMYEGNMRFLFGSQLVVNQDHLTVLQIAPLSSTNILLWASIKLVILKSSQTLQKISVEGCFCPEVEPREEFSCKIAQICPKLKYFRMSICGLKIINVGDLPAQLTMLDIGQMLENDDINNIACKLVSLEELWLLQGRSNSMEEIPKVTLEILKKILRMPKITQIVLSKKSMEFRRILKFSRRKDGLNLSKSTDPDRPETNYILTVDRNCFDSQEM